MNKIRNMVRNAQTRLLPGCAAAALAFGLGFGAQAQVDDVTALRAQLEEARKGVAEAQAEVQRQIIIRDDRIARQSARIDAMKSKLAVHE